MHVWIMECGDLSFITNARDVQPLIMESSISWISILELSLLAQSYVLVTSGSWEEM